MSKSRAPKFVPEVIKELKRVGEYECLFSDVPESYQKQPYNLAAKLKSRCNIQAKVYFNKSQNTFTIKQTC